MPLENKINFKHFFLNDYYYKSNQHQQQQQKIHLRGNKLFLIIFCL